MSFEPFLALEASAGSGKTFALSVRFIALILMGAKINEILAISFTKKATNEMKERILSTFLNLEKKEAELKALCELLEKNESEILSLRNARKTEFLRARLKIFTFDSFFTKILKAFSLNLGLMSDFALQDKELDTEEVFLEKLNEKELKSLAFYLEKVDSNFFNHLQTLYDNDIKIDKKVNSTSLNQSIKLVNDAFLKFKNYALNLSTAKNYIKNFDFESIENKAVLNKLCEKPVICDLEKDYFKKIKEDTQFLDLRKKLLIEIKNYTKTYDEFKMAEISSFLKHFEEARIFLNKSKNTLSFQDVAKNVLKLIKSEDKELIYFRLDGAISHLLIDEFQDTNLIQYEILKPILQELLSGKGTKEFRSFFYVGDKKQSIYRFRNSKKELFDLLQKQFPQIKVQSLDTNYRSCENLVNFVNETFGKIYENYTPQKALESKKGGFLRIRTSCEQDAKEQKEKAYEAVFEELLFLQENGGDLNKTCVLCWKNDDADELVEFLQEKGLKAFTQSNILLEKKASVALLLNYAKYCIFGDDFYLQVCKSLLNDDELVCKEYLKLAKNESFQSELFIPQRLNLRLFESPVEICVYLIKKLGLSLDDSALVQFLEYASTKQNFLELLFEECSLKINNEENFGISVMTYHKSKGLEFESVILLDNLLQTKPKGSKILTEYDVDLGLELCFKDDIKENIKDKSYMKFIQKKEKNDKEDKLNTLYVAFTRAKNNLFIIKKNEAVAKGGNFSYFCGAYLNLPNMELSKPLFDKDESKQENLKNELESFEKVPKQELKTEVKAKNKEIIFGDAFHFFMQNFDFKESNLENLKARTAKKFRHILDEKSLNLVFERVQNLILNEEFKALIKDKTLFKEQALSFEGQLKQLDLLCLSENEAFVIDYKTGQSFENEHKIQLSFYKKAIKNILKKPITRAFLVYCLEKEIKILEF